MEQKQAKCQYPGCDKEVRGLNPKKPPRYCPEHLKIIRRQALEKAHKIARKSLLEKEVPAEEIIKGADGLNLRLENADEREFYLARKKQYESDFEWNLSSDGNLLQRLLSLEIESRRIERELSYTRDKSYHKKRKTTEKTRLLIKLSEEIRQLERDLGITRGQRLKQREDKDAATLFKELFQQYKEFCEKQKLKPKQNLKFNEKEKYWEEVPADSVKNNSKEPQGIEQKLAAV